MKNTLKKLTKLVDESKIQKWASKLKSKVISDTITLDPLIKFQTTLETQKVLNEKEEIHPASHWIYFSPYTPTSKLSYDGYESEFTPPDFEKRMFAGGEVFYQKPLKLKGKYTRFTNTPTVTLKEGKSGQLCFVQVKHEIKDEYNDLCITDLQNFVYRNSNLKLKEVGNDPREDYSSIIMRKNTKLDEILLFRFSSLTWNSHKIHYDKQYAKLEGYEDIIVHGPLSSTLLLDLIHSLDRKIISYQYQALRPLFCKNKVNILGKLGPNNEINVWIEDQNDQNIKYMEGKAILEQTSNLN